MRWSSYRGKLYGLFCIHGECGFLTKHSGHISITIHCPHSHPTVDQGKRLTSRFSKNFKKCIKNGLDDCCTGRTAGVNLSEHLCSWSFYQVVSPEVSWLDTFLLAELTFVCQILMLSFQPSKQRKKMFKL